MSAIPEASAAKMPEDRRPSGFELAYRDLRDGLASLHLWPMLGWMEIRQRYRRSVLGPFWLTISTGVMVAGIGLLYGKLFRQDISLYFQYLAISLILWQFVAGLVTEACTVFIASESYIKQIKLPLTVHVLRVVWKNLIIFLHNLVIVALVLAYFKPTLGWSTLLAPIGWMILAINGIWMALLLGMLSARFRDIPQIVGSVVQAAFFLTPVMWQKEMLGEHQWTVYLNPFYHLLEIGRGPLLGYAPDGRVWFATALITVVGFAVTLALFSRFRARIAYWV